MKQVKALKLFRDKDTQLLVEEGAVIEKSEARAKELEAGEYVKILNSADGEKSKPEKETVETSKPAKEPAPENKAKTITTDNIAKAEPAKSKPSTKEEKKFD